MLTLKKILTGQPSYIHNLLPSMRNFYQHANWFNTVSSRSKYFKNVFIPNTVNESNKLDLGIRSSTWHKLFCNTLLEFIWPAQRKTFNINHSVLIKLLTMLRLGFKHLREYKFRHRFRHILIPLYHCGIKDKTTTY